MRTGLFTLLMLLASMTLYGCVDVDDDAMPDTVVVEDTDPPQDVDVDIDVEETP